MPEGGGRLLALRGQFEAALPAGAASDAGAELQWQELRKLLECGDVFCLSRSVLTEEAPGGGSSDEFRSCRLRWQRRRGGGRGC